MIAGRPRLAWWHIGGAAALGVVALLPWRPPTRVYAQAGCVTDPAGGPTCEPPPPQEEKPTKTPRPRPPVSTFTPTMTPTPTCDLTTGIGCPTSTPSSTPTLTLVPTATLLPTPAKTPPSPLVDLITTIIGKFAPDPELTAPLPPWMQPPNIELTGLEITQVIQCFHNLQCPDNSVPLFSGKLTMVRAYVRFKAPPYYWANNIGGALCFGDTGNTGCENPIRPLYKIQVWEDPDPVRYARPQLIYTLDFILPAYFVTGGATKQITVYANYNFEDFPKETYYKDNHRLLQYEVETSEPMYVTVHLVHNLNRNNPNYPNQLQYVLANPGAVWVVYDFLDLTYPTSEIHLSQGSTLWFRDYDTALGKNNRRKGWDDLLNDLWWLRNGSGPIAYGLMPSVTLRGAGGMGAMDGSMVSGGQDNSLAGKTAAQEIGHNLGRAHAPGCSAGNPDVNFPGLNGGIDEVGVDVLHRKVYDPSNGIYDYMGYCGAVGNTWTSIYTYEAMAGQLPAGAYLPSEARLASPLPADAEVLLASGQVSPTVATLEHGFYRLPAGSATTATPDDGPYAVDLLDEKGNVLATHRFAPMAVSNGEPSDSGPFHLLLPWTDGTSTVVFRYLDQEIGRVKASRHAPEVAFTSPAEGVAWGASGSQTIAWTGHDADGDPLQYLLQYSSDGGQSWEVLAPNLTDTSFEIDTSYLPGSDHAQLRLLASDGFNTVSVDSAPLQVAGKAPEVHISGPSADDELFAGAPIILQGAATDLEDGFLGDEALSWSSDRDGILSNGRSAVLAGLSEGPHTLTLTAIDSDGNAGTASVDVIVRPQPVAEVPAPAVSPVWCVAGVLVIGGGALGLAFLLGRRSRRASAGTGT